MARQGIHNRRAGRGNTGGGASWISYSDMMAALLLLFVLILCVSLYHLDQTTKALNEQSRELEQQQIILIGKQDELNLKDLELNNKTAELDEKTAALVIAQNELDDKTAALLTAQGELEDNQAALIILQSEFIQRYLKMQSEQISVNIQILLPTARQ